MKSFLYLALGIGALLASPSAQAHSHPAMPKGLHLPATHIERKVSRVFTYSDVVGLRRGVDSVAALASPATGPTAHVSVSSSHPSFGGFHSTPSYHSYSPSPSRSFTFRSSSPSISTRPAATSTPRTYNYNPFARSAPSTPVSRPAEVHHYHNSGGGGGLSATEVILLNQALNSGHQSQTAITPGATGRYASSDIEATQAAELDDEGISGWGIFGIVILCLACAAAFCFVLHRLSK
jgi:hypothetical protein